MKQTLITILVVALAGGIAAQQAQPPDTGSPSMQQQAPAAQQAPATQAPATATTPSATPEQSASRIAPGSIIPAKLTKTVDAKKAKKGDEVVATVPGDLKATNGQVLVPKDTKIIGHVTEAQPRSKDQKESQLGIAFNQMTMKDGQQVQLPLSIQAIVAPPKQNPSANGSEPSTGGGPSGGSTSNAPSGSSRSSMGGGGNYPQSQGAQPQPSGGAQTTEQASSNPNPPITENTKGVVGIKDLTLSPAQDAASGAVVTSEKNNVKLEDGTMLLLRVAPASPQNQPNSTPQNPQQ